MQIPGLSLLNGDPPPIDVDQDKPLSPSTTGSLLSSTLGAPADNNAAATAETLQTSDPSSEVLGRPDFDSAVTSKIANAESSIDLVTKSTSETITHSGDALDIALARCSEESSAERDAEEHLGDSDIGSASRPESDDERLSDILETARFGSLEELDDEGDDLEDGPGAQVSSIRTKNEAIEDLGPVNLPNLAINENAKIELLGTTEKLMGTVAIVRAHTGGEYRVLDEGAVVVTNTRDVVGVISETFGPVKQPRYVVRLVPNQVKDEANLVDQTLFYVPDRASFVFTYSLQSTKGSDASNIYDEEINEEEREFSDDEAEIEHKRSLKRKRGQEKKSNTGHDRTPRREPTSSADPNHGLMYRPLTRPPTQSVPSAGFLPLPRTSDNGRRGTEYRELSSRYEEPFGTSSVYNPVQSFPQLPHVPYNQQFTPHPVMSGSPHADGYLRNRDHASLPPGAYVNPAFFNRPLDANVAVTNISTDAQREMENILSNLLPRTQ